jgi:hypothetical protein
MTEYHTSITSGNALALAACLMMSVIVVFFSSTCKQTTTRQLSFKSITIHHPLVTLFSTPDSVTYRLKHSTIT